MGASRLLNGNSGRRRALAIVTAFPFFWVVAFTSQLTAGALITCLSWFIGSPALPAWTPLVNQVVALVLATLGAWVGHKLSARLDLAAIVALCSGGQGLVVLLLLLSSFGKSGEPPAVWLLIAVAGLAHLLIGAAGPAWVVLVSRWPGSTLDPPELLRRESSQFQLANFLGPLIGGALLAARNDAVVVLALADAATWCLVLCYFLVLRRHPRYDRQPVSPASGSSSGSDDPSPRPLDVVRRDRVNLLLATAALSIMVDAPRAYLARLIQVSGGGEYLFGLVLAAGALAAAAMGLFGGRITARLSESGRAVLGMTLALFGIAGWLTATDAGWVLGALAIGAGTGLSAASISALLIEVAPKRAVASMALMGVLRRTTSVAGGIAIAGALAVGVVPLLPAVAVGTAGVALLASRNRSARRQQSGRLANSPSTSLEEPSTKT